MAEQEDKAKKLKEIQERLAEIQKKAKGPSLEQKTPAPEKKAEPVKAAPEIKTITPIAKEQVVQDEPKAVPPKPEPKTAVNEVKKAVAKPANITQEEKNWRANKPKEVKPEGGKVKNRKNKLTKVYTIVSLLVTALVCTYFIYTFFIQKSSDEMIVSKVPVVMEEETPSEETEETPDFIQEETKEAEAAITEEAAEVVQEVKKEAPPKKVVQPKEEKIRPIATSSAGAQKIPNGVIISYASNSTKDLAYNNVKVLKNKGFNASYYYMPDKDPSSPSLYKVYVGPYKDESAAMSDFKKIVEINDKAFILRAD